MSPLNNCGTATSSFNPGPLQAQRFENTNIACPLAQLPMTNSQGWPISTNQVQFSTISIALVLAIT